MIDNKDTDLWNRFRQGEQQALYTLYEKYYHLLLFLVLKICARSEPVKDCIQQMFYYFWYKTGMDRINVEIKLRDSGFKRLRIY